MMDTLLNIGINDEVVRRLGLVTNSKKFSLSVYIKFLYMWGTIVFNLPKEQYHDIISQVMKEEGTNRECWISIDGQQKIIREFKKLGDAPTDPFEQLKIAIETIFLSWQGPRYDLKDNIVTFRLKIWYRAAKFRSLLNIPESLGTAVIIQSMVYGNLNAQSCSGKMYSRNPNNGENRIYGK